MSTIKLKRNIEIEDFDGSKRVFEKKVFGIIATPEPSAKTIKVELKNEETGRVSTNFQRVIQLTDEGEQVAINQSEVDEYNTKAERIKGDITASARLVGSKETALNSEESEVKKIELQTEIDSLRADIEEYETALQMLLDAPIEPIFETQNTWGDFWENGVKTDANGYALTKQGRQLIRSKVKEIAEATDSE